MSEPENHPAFGDFYRCSNPECQVCPIEIVGVTLEKLFLKGKHGEFRVGKYWLEGFTLIPKKQEQ